MQSTSSTCGSQHDLKLPTQLNVRFFVALTMSLHLWYWRHYCRCVQLCLSEIRGASYPRISCLRIAQSSSTQIFNSTSHRILYSTFLQIRWYWPFKSITIHDTTSKKSVFRPVAFLIFRRTEPVCKSARNPHPSSFCHPQHFFLGFRLRNKFCCRHVVKSADRNERCTLRCCLYFPFDAKSIAINVIVTGFNFIKFDGCTIFDEDNSFNAKYTGTFHLGVSTTKANSNAFDTSSTVIFIHGAQISYIAEDDGICIDFLLLWSSTCFKMSHPRHA